MNTADTIMRMTDIRKGLSKRLIDAINGELEEAKRIIRSWKEDRFLEKFLRNDFINLERAIEYTERSFEKAKLFRKIIKKERKYQEFIKTVTNRTKLLKSENKLNKLKHRDQYCIGYIRLEYDKASEIVHSIMVDLSERARLVNLTDRVDEVYGDQFRALQDVIANIGELLIKIAQYLKKEEILEKELFEGLEAGRI